jgi:hypothetical protein
MAVVISLSEVRRLHKMAEEVAAKNFTVEQRLGYRPTPEAFAEAVLGGMLDVWQKKYMSNAMTSSRIAIAACRQSGKSTVTALFIAWCLVFIPRFQCLVASRSLRQASHFLNTVRQAVLSVIPRDAMAAVNRLSMELPNGSMIISIPCAQPDAGRGFSPNFVLLDEAAFAPDPLFRAISPSLAATQGALHMISSPNGRQGYFFEAFEGSAQDVYETQRITWTECPRINPAFIEEEKIALGDLYFRQEYGAEFITPMGAFFGFNAQEMFAAGEDEPIGDMELLDLEKWLSVKDPLPAPSRVDMQQAFDRASRVQQLLAG